MIEIKIENPIKDLENEINKKDINNGLILVLNPNQNFNMYIALEVLGILLNILRNKEKEDINISNRVFNLYPEGDNYYLEWAKYIETKEVKAGQIIWAGTIRDENKAKEVIEISKVCNVIAIMHTMSKTSAYNILLEMGVKRDILEKSVNIIISKK